MLNTNSWCVFKRQIFHVALFQKRFCIATIILIHTIIVLNAVSNILYSIYYKNINCKQKIKGCIFKILFGKQFHMFWCHRFDESRCKSWQTNLGYRCFFYQYSLAKQTVKNWTEFFILCKQCVIMHEGTLRSLYTVRFHRKKIVTCKKYMYMCEYIDSTFIVQSILQLSICYRVTRLCD